MTPTLPGAPGTPPGTDPSTLPGTTPSPTPAHLQVTAKEYSFALSRPGVAGSDVIIQLVNRGQDAHNLHIEHAGGSTDIGALPSTEPNANTTVRFTLPAGTYTLYCSLVGHRAAGMQATLTVD